MPNPRGINQYSKGGGAKKKSGGRKYKGPKGGPTSQVWGSSKRMNRVDSAALMYGKGSKQHKAAIKRWG